MNATGKVIATDLDGTLFFPKKRIRMFTKPIQKFLTEFIDGGGKLVIVSGRNKLFYEKIKNKLNKPVDCIGCNSSFIIADNKYIKEEFFDNKKIKEDLKKMQQEYPITGIFLMTKDYNFIVPKKNFWWFHRIGYKIYQLSEGTYKEKSIMSDELIEKEINEGKIYKIMLFFGITNSTKKKTMFFNKELSKKFPDYEFSWCGQLIEVNPKNCFKASGIKQYLDYFKIKYNNVMVVGDSGNDISMFKEFENSFCMRHAPIRVSKYANHVLKNFSELKNYIEDKKENL